MPPPRPRDDIREFALKSIVRQHVRRLFATHPEVEAVTIAGNVCLELAEEFFCEAEELGAGGVLDARLPNEASE